ncbi:MAG: tetratricopeptide repeat protein [Anaerolineaceae bacterium]
MKKKRRRGNPLMILLMLLAIGGLIYINLYVVPDMEPPFVPTPTATRPPESYLEEADALALEGKFLGAIEAYQAAINADPKNVETYLKIARLQIYNNMLPQAKVNSQNAILLNNQIADAYALLGWVNGFQKDYMEGEKNALKAIEIDPNSSLGHAIYAFLLGLRIEADLRDLDTMDKAIEESRTAVALNPSLLEAHWARGYILELTSNYEEAVAEYEKALAINPNVSDLHMAMGRNLFTLRRNQEAIFEFSKAFALNPSNADANRYISLVWQNEGEYAKAVQYADEAVKIRPTDPYLHANLGTMYFRQALYNQAIPPLQLAVRGGKTEDEDIVEPIPLDYRNGSIAIFTRYGVSLARVNRCTEAGEVANEMLSGVPDDAIAVDNANEILRICQENLSNPPTATPAPTPTYQSGPTSTPQPTSQP